MTTESKDSQILKAEDIKASPIEASAKILAQSSFDSETLRKMSSDLRTSQVLTVQLKLFLAAIKKFLNDLDNSGYESPFEYDQSMTTLAGLASLDDNVSSEFVLPSAPTTDIIGLSYTSPLFDAITKSKDFELARKQLNVYSTYCKDHESYLSLVAQSKFTDLDKYDQYTKLYAMMQFLSKKVKTRLATLDKTVLRATFDKYLTNYRLCCAWKDHITYFGTERYELDVDNFDRMTLSQQKTTVDTMFEVIRYNHEAHNKDLQKKILNKKSKNCSSWCHGLGEYCKTCSCGKVGFTLQPSLEQYMEDIDINQTEPIGYFMKERY